MKSAYTKPLPKVTSEDRPFWEACKQHKFVLPKCKQCGNVWFPPYLQCNKCLSPNREFVEASGRGVIWGRIEMNQPYIPAFVDDIPYVVALIQLEEGPFIYTNVVGATNDTIKVGLPVEVVFDDVTPDFTLPKFRLLPS